MAGESIERWRILCERAAQERDPEKLLALITEINRLLDEKRNCAGERPASVRGASA